MQPASQDARIERMYRGDRIWSFIAIAVLWITILFVFFKISPQAGSGMVVAALVVSGGLVLLFNSASIVALLKHYRDDKRHLYGLDLHYLDEMRRRR